MKVHSLRIQNVRSYVDTNDIYLSPKINLLVGRNNAGKSTLLKGLMCLQYDTLKHEDRRVENKSGVVLIELDHPEPKYFGNSQATQQKRAIFREMVNSGTGLMVNGSYIDTKRIPTQEPSNFIYPFLSYRNKANLTEDIKFEHTREVIPNFSLLSNRIDRIGNPQHPAFSLFSQKCLEILDLPISTFASANGKSTGLITDSFSGISINAMGSGTIHVVALIEYLCVAENKLILIEELENDLHPTALKKLLEFIIEKSSSNQFVISTHSNIVCKYLGAEPQTKIFEVEMKLDPKRIPVSTISEIANTKTERIRLLMDLGYELWDFELWGAWIILEESSAERIIKDYLIPWFVPNLTGKVRTISTNGVSKIKATFSDFKRLFTFIHLEEAYRHRAWVLVDGNDEARTIVASLRNAFRGWDSDHFRYFEKDDFELYYPDKFSRQVADALVTMDSNKKREKKEQLLKEVLIWIESDSKEAQTHFSKSAREIIDILKEIEAKVSTL
jgi:predicted ATPase